MDHLQNYWVMDLQTPVLIASGAFGFGTGDFTIEFWGHFTATGDQGNRNARIITPQSESGTYIPDSY